MTQATIPELIDQVRAMQDSVDALVEAVSVRRAQLDQAVESVQGVLDDNLEPVIQQYLGPALEQQIGPVLDEVLDPKVQAVVAPALAGKADVEHEHAIGEVSGLNAALNAKQDALVSGQNIKTINGQPITGSGDIQVAAQASLGDHQPSALGTAAAGSSTLVSRSDHVHPMPTAMDVGAEPAGAINNHISVSHPHPQYTLTVHLEGMLAAKAAADHTHTSEQIQGLGDLLSDKAALNHTHTPGQVGADPAGSAANAITAHTSASNPHNQYALKTALASVASSGDYNHLTNRPTLGSAAAANVSAFATAAQGAKADSAVQPGSLALVATSGSYMDLTSRPVIPTSAFDVGAEPAGSVAAHAASGAHDERYYTKTQIDDLLGDVGAVLDQINGETP